MSKLALKLIAENKRTRATSLDLGRCGLTELPKELGELVWLEEINFGSWRVTWDGESYRGSATTNTGPANDKLQDITLLARLPKLRVLSADQTGINNLAPLAGLTALQGLYLNSTQVTDLAPLVGLTALQKLNLNSTQVSDLAPLVGLTALQHLDLNATQVTDLAPLAGLTALQKLVLDYTKVMDLTPLKLLFRVGLAIGKNPFDAGLNIFGCPITIPPPEIVAQGREAILNYFRERETGAVDHLYEAKMLLLGEGGAGKTSLLRRLYQPELPLPEEEETTKGIAIYRHEFPLDNGRTFRLNVWDFGGQEIYHATHQFFLTHRSLYLLLDDTRKDHKTVSDPGFKDWLDITETFGGNSPMLLFQNEKGGRSKTIGLYDMQARYPFVRAGYKGNLQYENAADEIRQAIEKLAVGLPHIGEELPAKWVAIRAALEQRAQQTPYISQEEYFALYSQHLPFDRTKARFLSRYFHDLGVCLHFQDDPLLTRTLILQNNWATEAVYRLLDDEQVKARLGHFDRADCERLWADARYANMHPELLALMLRFELCYLLPDSKPPGWFAPQLLAADKPEPLQNWARPGDLVLRYSYPFLPKGMLARLMVRQHGLVRDPNLACLTCIPFAHGQSEAIVERLPNGTEIELRARGPERKALLSALATELDALNDSFPGLAKTVEKRIPCQCNTCQTSAAPFSFDEANLRRRAEKNVATVQCDISFENQTVVTLLDGVQVSTLPEWAKPAKAEPLRVITVFLASSRELETERDAFELHFRRQNDDHLTSGEYVKIIRWETLSAAMSPTRKQDDYNLALQDCTIFVSLFATKAGSYTEEEFDAAWKQFQATGRPHIYTYFKETPVSNIHSLRKDLLALWAFWDKVEGLKHFPTEYKNTDELLKHFTGQLNTLRKQGKLD